MSNFLVDYTTYMRSLAEKHSSIRHTSEEKHFFRGELEEFWEQFRSMVNFPCLITERSELDYSGQVGQMIKKRTTSFLVVDRYDQHDDYDEILLKMSNCENIAEEIVGRMMTDEDSPVFDVEPDSLHGEYIQNEQERYVGYLMAFISVEPVCLINNNVWIEENETD